MCKSSGVFEYERKAFGKGDAGAAAYFQANPLGGFIEGKREFEERGGARGQAPGVGDAPAVPTEIDMSSQVAMRSRLARKRVLRGNSLLAAGAKERAEDALIDQPYATAKDRLGG